MESQNLVDDLSPKKNTVLKVGVKLNNKEIFMYICTACQMLTHVFVLLRMIIQLGAEANE